MPKFSANISLLFTEVAFLDRFNAAANAGFKAVECQFPYAYDAAEIASKLDIHGLELVLYNLPAGNWEAGDRGIACDPARIAEFQHGIYDALTFSTLLKTEQLNCLAGVKPKNITNNIAEKTLIENLRYASHRLSAAGIRLLIEPINQYDIPEFFISTSAQALALIASADVDNLFLQYDVYHMQRTEGELAHTIRANLARISHIQIADNPGRAEPGTGEINYRYLLPWLDEVGYQGWVGCEYNPRGDTSAGLGWLTDAAH